MSRIKVTGFVWMCDKGIISDHPIVYKDIKISEQITFFDESMIIDIDDINHGIMEDPRKDTIIDKIIYHLSERFLEWLEDNKFYTFFPLQPATIDTIESKFPNLSVCYYFDKTVYNHVFVDNFPIIMRPNQLIIDELQPLYLTYMLEYKDKKCSLIDKDYWFDN